MSTSTPKESLAAVVALLNQGGWRLMGGKIAREAYRAEYLERLPAGVKPKIKNCFFEDPRRIYIGSASLDNVGGIVLRVYENRVPTEVELDECREVSGVLVEPEVTLFDRGSKDYYGAKES